MLALAWVAITGSFTVPAFVLGLVVGWLSLFACSAVPGIPRYNRSAVHVLVLVAFTAWAVVLANVRLSRDLLLSRRLHSAIVSVPIRARTDAEVMLLAALITLTPGTTAVDVSADGTQMLVHVTNLPAGGPEQVRRDVREGFERRLLLALRDTD